MTGTLLDKALSRAAQGNRNETGLWLACQLRDNGYTEAEAEGVMLDYARQVSGNGTEPYTRAESIATLKSAYSKPTRAKGIEGDMPPYTMGNGYAAVLGMLVEEVIKLWQSAGAPIVHLGLGVNCLDLVKLLSRPEVSPEHLEAVKAWLKEHRGGEL